MRLILRLGGMAMAALLCAAARPAMAQTEAPLPEAPPAEAPQPDAAIEQGLQDLFNAPLPQPGPDVFGYAAVEIGATRLAEQWRSAQLDSALPEGPWADLVDRIRASSLLARIQAVNSFANHHLVFADDESIYGVADHWAGLAETIARGRGDCEDFAIAKMQLLADAGVPERDLYLILVRDTRRNIDHAVAAVRDGERLYVLDSASDAVRTAEDVRGYQPVMSFSGENRWTFGLRTVAAPAEVQPGAEPSGQSEVPAPPLDPAAPPPYR